MWLSSVILLWTAVAGCAAVDDLPWWKTAVLYQVYPRSFSDYFGNGVGNFKGITKKAPYFKEIGVTAIWLSPIFKSPMADMGYDIADFRMVDPIFGTNDDFIELIQTLRKLDIKILLDLVPNHTSDEHEWFQKSVERIDPYTDYYVWVDPKIDLATGERAPPNNWVSNFTGTAWEWNEKRQQYYLHQFLIKQPDLNYRNPLVVQEIDDIIVFWLDKGIDGFRVDAIPFIYENKELKDNPVHDGVVSDLYTQNQPETYELVQHWADLVYNYSNKDGRDRALFLEAYASLNNTLNYYGKGNHSFMQPFNFMLLTKCSQTSRAKDFKEVILSWLDNMPEGAAANWVIGNHDNPRATTRFGPVMIDALNLLTGVLPGCKVTYYGEEIGMNDHFVRWDQTVDPAALFLGPDRYQKASRDPERTPMQWDDSDNAGFSSSESVWLPVNPDYWEVNVEAQRNASTSHLKVFQAMTAARENPVLRLGDVSVLVPNNDTLVVVRKLDTKWFALIINMGSDTAKYTTEDFFAPNGLDSDSTVVTSSINTGIKSGTTFKKGNTYFKLKPQGAVLLKSEESA